MREIVEKAQMGCTVARTRLATVLRPRLMTMARYYSRKTWLDYEDLLQEAWVAVYEALPETKLNIGEPEEYLMRRARWAVLDYLKWSLRRQMEPLEDWTPERQVAGAEGEVVARAAVERVAEGLSEMQRKVLGLMLAGDSCTDAAQTLGCTTANVSYHLGQVRRQMEGVLGEREAVGV